MTKMLVSHIADSLRTWDFQGSIDGNQWVLLRRHTNDTALNGPFATHTWPILSGGASSGLPNVSPPTSLGGSLNSLLLPPSASAPASPFPQPTIHMPSSFEGYRYFRILQTGHNSSNHNFLVLSGVELYGELYEKSF